MKEEKSADKRSPLELFLLTDSEIVESPSIDELLSSRLLDSTHKNIIRSIYQILDQYQVHTTLRFEERFGVTTITSRVSTSIVVQLLLDSDGVMFRSSLDIYDKEYPLEIYQMALSNLQSFLAATAQRVEEVSDPLPSIIPDTLRESVKILSRADSKTMTAHIRENPEMSSKISPSIMLDVTELKGARLAEKLVDKILRKHHDKRIIALDFLSTKTTNSEFMDTLSASLEGKFSGQVYFLNQEHLKNYLK